MSKTKSPHIIPQVTGRNSLSDLCCACGARALLRQRSHLLDVAEEAVLNEHGNYNDDAKGAAHIAADALIGYLLSQLSEP